MMASMSRKAVVIGAGIVGCATALELARRGWSVQVIEQHAAAGIGSTARSSTVIRCHYTRPEAIALALEGRLTWERWAAHLQLTAPRAVYRPVGVLFLLQRSEQAGRGPESLGMKAEMDDQGIDERCQMMRDAGVDAHLLNAPALRDRFPAFAFNDDSLVGIWEPDSGYVAYPTPAVLDLEQAARVDGVSFRFNHRVVGAHTEWQGAHRVMKGVLTQGPDGEQQWDCDAVINCAGPHSHAVNLDLTCPLPHATAPQRQFILEATWKNPCPLPAMADLASGFYLRPDANVFKVGAVLPNDHVAFQRDPKGDVDPSQLEQRREVLLHRLAQRVPGIQLDNPVVRVAYYDWTVSDSYPLLGGTDVAGYHVAIGTSGAWFKSGPVLGALVAEHAHRAAKGTNDPIHTLPYSGATLDLRTFGVRRPITAP